MERIKKYEPLWGEWKVKQEIGEGSFGAVYKVERNLMGNTSCSAVKLISFNNSEMLRGIKMDATISAEELEAIKTEAAKKNVREAALMDKLQGSANIVTIHDYAIYSNEKTTDVLIRMEYLTNLRDYIEKVNPDTGLVIKLGIDICRALESCEKEKIIHRDIKPDNIFINKDGDFKLGDFGLSRKMNKSASMSLRQAKGTPLYMPPEAFGWGQHVDKTADVYSLGIVMYQLLNDGNIPFGTEKDDFEDEDNAIGRRLDGEEIAPPLHGEEGMWKIIKKACQYKKEDRYQSASEMRKDLEELKNARKLTGNMKTEEAIQEENVNSALFSMPFSSENILKKAQKAWDENNYEEAFRLYEKAACLGNTEGQNAMGYCYYAGYGTEEDVEKALFWFEKAAANGHLDAGNTAQMLRQRLEEEKLTEPKEVKASDSSLQSKEVETSESVKTYNIGDIVTFGSYPQDQDSSAEKKPIEWIVLEKEADKMLVLSKYVLDNKPFLEDTCDFDAEERPVTWEDSDIRKWLNDDFYKEAFNAEERAIIQTPPVGEDGIMDEIIPESDIFLLSNNELDNLLVSWSRNSLEEVLKCNATPYAIVQGADTQEGEDTSWWLRSSGNDIDNMVNPIAFVYGKFVHQEGCEADSKNGIRPAMWIKLNMPESKSIGKTIPLTSLSQAKPVAVSSAIRNYNVGVTIIFGSYEDGLYFGSEKPIKWLILKKEADKMLVISKKILDCKRYYDSTLDSSKEFWRNSDIRRWLNEYFYTEAFNDEEKGKIQPTLIKEEHLPESDTEPGKDTMDKVFLLSTNEVKSLFATDEKRICKPLDLSYDDRIYYWWLRSPYEEYDNAAFVDADGDFDGERVDSDYIGVRPAMWVKLED